MTTQAENTRLAVLETEVQHIKDDVAEIKSDVKIIIAAQAQIATNLAAKEAVAIATVASRAMNGTWFRFYFERILAIIAIVVAIAAFVRNGGI